MREGLRSGVKLLATTEKGETSPTLNQGTDKMEVDSTEEKDCNLTDDNVPKEEKLVSAPKEETEMDRRDGSQYEDFGAGSDIDGDKVVECTDNRRKRNRIDDKGESEVDSVKKQKVKGEVANGKLQVVGRVLRSRSAVKAEGEEKVEDEQSNGGFVGKTTRGRGESEEERVKANKEEGDHFNGENSSQSSNIFMKRKRGRPPKALQSELQKSWGNVEKREIDQSSVKGSCKKLKRKRGRPPKSRENDVSEKKCCDDGHQQNIEEIKKLKPRRGRPPKARENDESQKKLGDVDKEGIDLSVSQERHQPTSEEIKKLKPRRGRPPKAQESNWSEKGRVKIEEEESDQCATKESDQPNNQVRETLKRKLGRPPKAQKFDGSAKKMFEVANGGSDQSADEEGDESYCKVRKKLEPNHGKPYKGNKGKMMGALRKYKRGTTLKHSSSLSGKRFFGKEHNMSLLPVKKIKCNNGEKEGGNTKQKAGEMGHSRSERQVVRDKIVELLLDAGWKIEYRPRNGREYKDAVYVNPEGRTHWSITLAYRVLKKHYEDVGGDSKTCKSSFKFTPIPDEELNILTKVMNKERSDKNKKKRKWNQEEKGEKMIEVINNKKWKLHRKKLGAVAGVGYNKMLKRRTKPKSLHHKQDDSAVTSGEGTTVSVRGRKRLETHGRKRCALLVRNSQEGKESDRDGYVLYNGKRTVLAWMLGLGTVLPDAKVQYLKRRKARGVLKGRITTDGIHCNCCTKTFTIAEFEIHAGGKSCQPFKNIFLETGSSLLQCQLDSWNKQDKSAHKGFHFIDIDGEDPNDDTCGICGDGGDLICCDSCPSTFHQCCLEIKKFPSGSWHCIYCLCKFCWRTAGKTCQGNDNDTALLCALLTCRLCEEKYHRSCVQVKEAISDDPGSAISDDPGSSSFCGKKCQELYERLQTLFGVKHELEEGFSWTFVRRFDVGSDISHSGMPQKVECNSKVAVALHIMDECFLPMVDHRSGVNLIRNIVFNFGSNFNRLNYSGFFTAVLERGDEMIAAASIRIHGNHLAEMPFIGTRYMYRRQGMCRRLLSAIETALRSLNVEKLVIPAISELRETWTSVFGFKPLEGSNKQILRNMNMMVFPGVDMLQKPLLKQKFAEENMNPIEGSESTELGELHTMEDLTNKFEERCSPGFDLNDPSGTSLPPSGNIINELAALESGSLVPGGCFNGTSDITIHNANATKCLELGVTSNNLDGRNESVVSPFDSSCDAHKQTGDEMINNTDEKYSAGFDLKGSSKASVSCANNIIGDPAEAESGSPLPDGLNDASDISIQDVNSAKCIVRSGRISGEPDAADFGSLPDGCLNETSDVTIQDANNTKYHDQLGVVSDNLDRKIENMVNLPDSSYDANARTENCTGQQGALSATIGLPADNTEQKLDVQLNQHNLSEVESKSSAVSHTVSEAAIFDGELPCVSSDGTETVSCEVKIGSNVEHNPNTFGENFAHTTVESISTQSQGHGLKVSNGDAVLLECNAINTSCDVIQSRFPAACQRGLIAD